MKAAALILTALLLAACESTSTTTSSQSPDPRGVPLGDSNVRVSGSLSTGGTITNR